MFAPCGSSFGVTVICLLTSSLTACISAHSIVVVAPNAAVVDSSRVERLEGSDELPVSDPTIVVPALDATCVLPVSGVRVVWLESVPVP